MTAEYSNDRRRRRLVILVGLALAIVATAGAYLVLSRNASNQPTVTTRNVVVAAQAIPARTLIKADQVTTKSVPDSPVWAPIASDPNSVIGQLAIIDIPAGAPIATNLFGSGNAAGIKILQPDETLSPGSPVWRGVSVSVPKDRAVNGKLSPGDRVDLFVTLAPQIYDPNGGALGFSDPNHPPATTNGYYSTETTKVTWTNVEVLDVDTTNSIYVLKVDEAQAEEIAHVQTIGAAFTMALRPPGDERSFDPSIYGQTTNNMIDLFGFKIPQVIVVSSAPPVLGPTESSGPSASSSPGSFFGPSASPVASPSP